MQRSVSKKHKKVGHHYRHKARAKLRKMARKKLKKYRK